ncbi:unnamed protein product [Amoebophrya sp. A120]|nr:unnamed protein product [Amoebophrya sp. A120]|eukprot:GSA120T00010229001.1
MDLIPENELDKMEKQNQTALDQKIKELDEDEKIADGADPHRPRRSRASSRAELLQSAGGSRGAAARRSSIQDLPPAPHLLANEVGAGAARSAELAAQNISRTPRGPGPTSGDVDADRANAEPTVEDVLALVSAVEAGGKTGPGSSSGTTSLESVLVAENKNPTANAGPSNINGSEVVPGNPQDGADARITNVERQETSPLAAPSGSDVPREQEESAGRAAGSAAVTVQRTTPTTIQPLRPITSVSDPKARGIFWCQPAHVGDVVACINEGLRRERERRKNQELRSAGGDAAAAEGSSAPLATSAHINPAQVVVSGTASVLPTAPTVSAAAAARAPRYDELEPVFAVNPRGRDPPFPILSQRRVRALRPEQSAAERTSSSRTSFQRSWEEVQGDVHAAGGYADAVNARRELRGLDRLTASRILTSAPPPGVTNKRGRAEAEEEETSTPLSAPPRQEAKRPKILVGAPPALGSAPGGPPRAGVSGVSSSQHVALVARNAGLGPARGTGTVVQKQAGSGNAAAAKMNGIVVPHKFADVDLGALGGAAIVLSGKETEQLFLPLHRLPVRKTEPVPQQSFGQRGPGVATASSGGQPQAQAGPPGGGAAAEQKRPPRPAAPTATPGTRMRMAADAGLTSQDRFFPATSNAEPAAPPTNINALVVANGGQEVNNPSASRPPASPRIPGPTSVSVSNNALLKGGTPAASAPVPAQKEQEQPGTVPGPPQAAKQTAGPLAQHGALPKSDLRRK